MVLPAICVALALLANATPARALSNHSMVFSANTNGGIAVAANSSMACDTTLAACTTALAAAPGSVAVNNNDLPGKYIDVDSDVTTVSSSSATLTLPDGAEVLYALLAWGGDSTQAGRDTVKVATPAGGGYTSVVATTTSVAGSDNFACWTEITDLVARGGTGTYTVAGVRGQVGVIDSYAGWQVVVAYRDPSSPPRNLSIFAGHRSISPGAGVSIPISGFQAPASGDVNASVTVLGFEGDFGLTGDQLQLGTQQMVNASNPVNNIFNGSVSDAGARVTARNPAWANTLGVDSDTFTSTNAIATSATSVNVAMSTTNDVYYVATFATAIDLYAPELVVTKLPTDINGGNLYAGDVIEYEVSVLNVGSDGATHVRMSDAIPEHTTYVPDSLSVTQPGGAASAATDAAGDDAGEFISDGAGGVAANLGAGAGVADGGVLAPGASASMRFRVQVDPELTSGGEIMNTAVVTSNGQSVAESQYENQSNSLLSVEGLPIARPDLAVAIPIGSGLASAGVTARIPVRITNGGASQAPGSTVTGSFGTPLTSLAISGAPGGCTVNLAEGSFSCQVGALGVGARLNLDLAVVLPTPGSYTLTVTAATPEDELKYSNNTATTSLEVIGGSAFLDASNRPARRTVRAGTTVQMVASLRNTGTATAMQPRLCVRAPRDMSFASLGGGRLERGKLCWSWAQVAAGDGRTVRYSLRASRHARSTSPRASQAAASAANAGGVQDIARIRIVGGVTDDEPVTR